MPFEQCMSINDMKKNKLFRCKVNVMPSSGAFPNKHRYCNYTD